jgi:hypothetical protein
MFDFARYASGTCLELAEWLNANGLSILSRTLDFLPIAPTSPF